MIRPKKSSDSEGPHVDDEIVGADVDRVEADELELAVVERSHQVHARPDVEANGRRVVAGAEQVVPALQRRATR